MYESGSSSSAGKAVSSSTRSNSANGSALALIFFVFSVVILSTFAFASILEKNEEETTKDKSDTSVTENFEQTETETIAQKIIVDNIIPGEKVSSPLKVTGQAAGWYFEGQFGIVVIDETGAEIGEGMAVAQSDWMTSDYVPFEATISFDPNGSTEGKLILQKANPSDILEFDETYSIPVTF